MKFSLPWQRTTWEDAIKANVFLSITSTAMAVIALASVLHSQSLHERVVLVPNVVDRQMAVGWQTADEEYIKAFGLSVAQLVGNITPQNVTFVVESMSRFMHASIYSDLRKNILAVADTRQYRELSNATRYLSTGILYEPDTGKVFVLGDLEITSATGKEKRPMVYEMIIKIEGGKPVVYSFNNYQDQPRTKEWLEKQPPKQEAQGASK